MADYELLLNKNEKIRDFYRYRLSAFYYLIVLLVTIFLITNFFSYSPDVSEASSEEEAPAIQPLQNNLPVTTTPAPPSAPYNYSELPLCSQPKSTASRIDPTELMTEFNRCASMILMRFQRNAEGLLFNWPYTVYVCDEEDELMKIPLRSFENGEKNYWAVLPNCQEESTFITLGTGGNSKAQDDLKEMVGNLTTYGTDPFLSENESYDHFFPVALSNNEPNLEMRGTFGRMTKVPTAWQRQFFNETVAVKRIDMLWINPNAGNFEYWNYLNENGKFDEMGIVVCQLNIEINKEDAAHWEQLIMPLVKEKRYVFMRPMATEGGQVTRTFFLNAKDPECVRKYLL